MTKKTGSRIEFLIWPFLVRKALFWLFSKNTLFNFLDFFLIPKTARIFVKLNADSEFLAHYYVGLHLRVF
jgi:hypothetical protein